MEPRFARIRTILASGLAASAVLAAAQFWVGWHLRCLAILAAALHSIVHGASGVLQILAAQRWEEHPDPGRPRACMRASLAVAGLLLLCGWELAGTAWERLARSSIPPAFSWAGLMFIASTLGIRLGIASWQNSAGHHLDSPLLSAEARHTQSDVLAAALAAAGLLSAPFSWPALDPLATLASLLLMAAALAGLVNDTVNAVVLPAPPRPALRPPPSTGDRDRG
jgi:divalent metal cation (Fe/Co/Zn/Cd) transporter